jgi:predicted small lipoprotein YifL
VIPLTRPFPLFRATGLPIVLALALPAAGCGNKGPLYLPSAKPAVMKRGTQVTPATAVEPPAPAAPGSPGIPATPGTPPLSSTPAAPPQDEAPRK